MNGGDLAAFLVVLAGGLLASWLVDRILPLRHKPEETAELAALSARYRRWQFSVIGVWLFVLLPATIVVTWRLLTRLAATQYRKLGPAEISFFPSDVEWGFPVVFLAAVISITLLWLGVRFYLGSRYAEYRRYERLQWGLGNWTAWLSLIGL